MVLAILTILTLLGVSFTFVMRTEMKAAGNFASKTQANYMAESGIAAVKDRLQQDRQDADGHLTVYSGFSKSALDIKSVNGIFNPDVKVVDEESKINLLVALDTTSLQSSGSGLSLAKMLAARFSESGYTFVQNTTMMSSIVQKLANRQCKTIDDLKSTVGDNYSQLLADYVTFYSAEANLDINSNKRLNINKATPKQIYDRLKTILPKELSAQLAVNIVNFRKTTDNIPEILTIDGITYRGVDINPFINEVMPYSKTPDQYGNRGNYVELLNPWNQSIQIDGWYLEGAFGTIKLYGNIPAHGYMVITDMYTPVSDFGEEVDNGYCYLADYGQVPLSNLIIAKNLHMSKRGDHLQLYDEAGNLIDSFNYGNSSKNVSWERNDPRVDKVYANPNGSGYSNNRNCVLFHGLNDLDNLRTLGKRSFSHLSDLAFVSLATPSTQWMTVSDYSTDSYNWGNVLDLFSLSNDSEKRGAVNINTASYEVLMALPGMTTDLAKAIVADRKQNGPFKTIADILRIPAMKEPAVIDNKRISGLSTLNKTLYNFTFISDWLTVRSYNFTVVSQGRWIENRKQLAESRITALLNRSGNQIVTISEKPSLP